ncbi:neurofilament light polypeptide [Etheostoma spectabile]|uniref:neurofilament light polypeptide n=1 Tax=Etheostoma spectabile TaxID=54343 RepID=UPI0013AFE35E|nr:neurofilament light polypeptide-like [Etheostoma spectabile]XP_032365903.1 neurofilament light polypeptide-like [Etheostoma spectabile]
MDGEEASPSDIPGSEVVALSAAEPFETPSASVTPLRIPASHPPVTQLLRKNKPVLRTLSPRCKNCSILAAELKVVKDLLEAERNNTLKPLHSSTSREKAVMYKRRKSCSPLKGPQYYKLVEEFREHTQGCNATRKTRENARQRANHVLCFLEFMSKPAVPHVNLLFLEDYGRIRKFAAHLAERNFKPTTIKSYLTDAVAFVKYIMSMSPEVVKIGMKSLDALLVELRARIRDVARSVVGQQLAQRHKKSDQLVNATHHAWFIENAPAKISSVLESLEKRPAKKKKQRMFFGLLSGYIVALTGHRKGVVLNMTRKEVQAADKLKNGRHIIRVEQHKTGRYFGQAAIPLEKNEYSWFLRYNCLRSRIEGGLEAETFFHTSSGTECLKLQEYFKEAWDSLELGKAPSFNLLRSSVATYSKRQLGSKAYKRVAAFMCHDEHTAKKFYHVEDPAAEVFRSRHLSIMAISTYAVKESKAQGYRATEDTCKVEDRGSEEDQDSEEDRDEEDGEDRDEEDGEDRDEEDGEDRDEEDWEDRDEEDGEDRDEEDWEDRDEEDWEDRDWEDWEDWDWEDWDGEDWEDRDGEDRDEEDRDEEDEEDRDEEDEHDRDQEDRDEEQEHKSAEQKRDSSKPLARKRPSSLEVEQESLSNPPLLKRPKTGGKCLFKTNRRGSFRPRETKVQKASSLQTPKVSSQHDRNDLRKMGFPPDGSFGEQGSTETVKTRHSSKRLS